ncbi:hypothetical protein DV737_g4399, partial [Chaetothyriales sp. CBS 132003]
MHEFSLYGQVSGQGYSVLLQQLAGVARMQPQYVRELHLVYKSIVPPGLRLIPGATNSDRIQSPEVQRVSKMLTNSLYYVHLVASIEERKTSTVQSGQVKAANDTKERQDARTVNWRLDFKDIPEPGTQVVTSRLISSIPIEGGTDLVSFMKAFGFEYVSRHFVEGAQFYDQDTTLFLHRPLNIPPVEPNKATDLSFLDDSESVKPVDASGAYLVQASIEAVDGTNSELKDRATRQLLGLKETLKQAIDLEPGDRLAAVANFFKPASAKDAEKKISWRVVGNSLVTGRYGPQVRLRQGRATAVKIAAFDLDDTIVSPVGNKWARGPESWKWWHPSVPERLRSLHDQGYLVTIFSNQANVSVKDAPKKLPKDTASLANLKAQLASIVQQLDLPISFYAATAHDRYRKPRTGMWDELLEDYDLQSDGLVDMSQSFYVGDAAGREKSDERRKDHATSDRDLAANIGIDFKTPEQFFLGAQVEPYERVFEPKQWLTMERTSSVNGHAPLPFLKKHKQELVIACGSPGSGKSTYFWHVLEPQGFKRVNQDRGRCLRVARDFLVTGDSVAVDNTNADVETRKYWITLAREFGIPIRCIHFTAPARLCEHNDAVRALNSPLMNPEGRTLLPGIAFRSFLQRFQHPKIDEGFEDITAVDFDFKGTPEQQAIWSKYWVSKFVT